MVKVIKMEQVQRDRSLQEHQSIRNRLLQKLEKVRKEKKRNKNQKSILIRFLMSLKMIILRRRTCSHQRIQRVRTRSSQTLLSNKIE